jgi:hypothetical protein
MPYITMCPRCTNCTITPIYFGDRNPVGYRCTHCGAYITIDGKVTGISFQYPTH